MPAILRRRSLDFHAPMSLALQHLYHDNAPDPYPTEAAIRDVGADRYLTQFRS